MTVTKFSSTHTPIVAALHAAFVGVAFATGAGGVVPSAHAGAGPGEESTRGVSAFAGDNREDGFVTEPERP